MKKNFLIITFPNYALLNFYEKYFIKYSSKFNFYIITNFTDETYFEKYELLKNKNIIKNYFFISPGTNNSFNFSLSLKNFSKSKKIVDKIKDIHFDKIICSDFSPPEIQFIIDKINYSEKSKIYSFNCHNYKFQKEIKIKNFILIFFKIRTVIKIIKSYIVKFIRYKILPFYFFGPLNKIYETSENFHLFHNRLDCMLTDKPYEYLAYVNKFESLKIKKIYHKNDTEKKPDNKMLVLVEHLKRENDYKRVSEEYVKYISFLNKKFLINQIFFKIHPREKSNYYEKILFNLRSLNQNINMEIIKENINISETIDEYNYIVGGCSAVMTEAINLNNSNIVFGLLNVGNIIVKNPGPKEVMGDILNLKSGVLWLEDYPNIINMDAEKIKYISYNLKKKRFENFVKSKSFEEYIF